MRKSAGVRGAGPVSVGWADTIISQGVYRTGADVLQAAGPARRRRQDRRARPRLRHALALEARHRAAAGERHRRRPELRQDDGPARDRRPLLVRHARRATASRSPRSCTTWRPNATLTLVNYHTELEFDAGRRLAHPRPRRQAAGRHRRPLEQLPRRPVRRHGRDRAQAVDAAHAAGHPVGQQRGNYAPAPLVGHGRRPRRRHVRRHDRRGRPDVLDPRQHRHGGDPAVVDVHRRRQVPSAARIGLVRARHHAGRGGDVVPLAQGLRDATRPLEIVSWTLGRGRHATSCAPAC